MEKTEDTHVERTSLKFRKPQPQAAVGMCQASSLWKTKNPPSNLEKGEFLELRGLFKKTA